MTPPFSNAFCTRAAITPLLTPPLGGFHTPSTTSVSAALASGCFCVVAAPYAAFAEFGTPGCVSRDGGSMVRMDSKRRLLPLSGSFSFPIDDATPHRYGQCYIRDRELLLLLDRR